MKTKLDDIFKASIMVPNMYIENYFVPDIILDGEIQGGQVVPGT